MIDQSTIGWYDSGGYYYLHKDVPLYRWDMPGTRIAEALRAPTRFASHWITESDTPPSPGYSLAARIGRIRVWERTPLLVQTEIARGYSTRAPEPFEELRRMRSPKIPAKFE